MTADLDKYKANLAIDKNSLDTCIQEQVILYSEVSEHYINALAIRDTKKKEMEEQYAFTCLQIRQDAANEGRKITEAGIKEHALTDDEYLASVGAHLVAKTNTDYWASLKEAYSQRSHMIKELAGLYVAGYFSDLTIKSEHPEEVSNSERRAKLTQHRRPLVKGRTKSKT